MITREEVERLGRAAAGGIDQRGNYTWCRVLDSFEMYVASNDKSVSPHLINDGFWESWITTWVMNNVGAGTVFFDIGANSGYYSLLAYQLGALVIAYEPNPTYAQMMRKTRERLGLDSGFQINEFALSNYEGVAQLHIPNELHGSASLNDIPDGYAFSNAYVDVKRLDNRVPGTGRQVLKIDAEGEEERILAGAEGFLNQAVHKTILMEYTPGAYSEGFEEKLFREWEVSRVTYDGGEESITPDWLRSLDDWAMIVLR